MEKMQIFSAPPATDFFIHRFAVDFDKKTPKKMATARCGTVIPAALRRRPGTVKRLLAYWLIPAQPHKQWFAELIRSLAARFDAPIFEPHVTIYAARTEAAGRPAAALEEATRGIRGVTLHVRELRISRAFTKSLFVEFARSEALASVSNALKNSTPAASDYELKPHLSLIYKSLDPTEKQSLADSIAIPFSGIFFDEIKAIIGHASTVNREDIESWRVIAARKLT